MTRLLTELVTRSVEASLRHRLWMAAATLGCLVFFTHQTVRIPIDPGFEVLLSERSDIGVALADLRAKFGDDLELILMVEGDDVRDPAYLSRLAALHEALDGVDVEVVSDGSPGTRGFERVTSILNAPILKTSPGQIELDSDSSLQPSSERLARLGHNDQGRDHSIDPLIHRGGKASLLLLRFGDVDDRTTARMYEAVKGLVDEHSTSDFEITIAGYPAFTAELSHLLVSDMARLLGFAILVAFGMLILIFRHWMGIVGPVLVFTIASVVTYGTMTLTNVPLTLITLYLPAFLICVGMADGVHVQTAYRTLRIEGRSREDAIVAAFQKTAMPLVLTTLTTCIGLLSLNTAQMSAVRQLGTFAALGMAVSLVATILVLPVVLSFDAGLGRPRKETGPDWLDAFIAGIRATIGRDPERSVWPFWASIAAVLVSVVASSQLFVHHDPLNWLPENHTLGTSMQRVDENFAGSSTITILVEPKEPYEVRDAEFLARLDRFSSTLLTYRTPHDERAMVGHVTSILDPVRETWRAMEPDAANAIPTTKEGSSAVFTMLELFASERLKDFVTLDGSSTQLKVHVRWADAGSYSHLIEFTRRAAQEHIGDSARVRMTGSALQMHSVADRLVTDLITSFAVALFTITLVIASLFASARLALLSLIPNLIPIAMILGFMGLAKIALDVHTVLMVSIALGIIVDDTIHFMHQFRSGLSATGHPGRAVDHAYAHSGRAIVTTTLTLVGGFSVYFAAELRHLHHVGLLFGLALLFALACDLTVTPALLARFGVARSPRAVPKPTPSIVG